MKTKETYHSDAHCEPSRVDIHKMYVDDGPKIFDDTWIDNLLDLGKLRGADYKTEPMEIVFKRVLGKNTTLGQLDKNVLITAFDLDNEHPNKKKREPGSRSFSTTSRA